MAKRDIVNGEVVGAWRRIRGPEQQVMMRLCASVGVGMTVLGLFLIGGWALSRVRWLQLPLVFCLLGAVLAAAVVWWLALRFIWHNYRAPLVTLVSDARKRFGGVNLFSLLLMYTCLLSMLGRALHEGYPEQWLAPFSGLVLFLVGMIVVFLAPLFDSAAGWRSMIGPEKRIVVECPKCGYDLTGLRELRCPECGEQFTIDGLIAVQGYTDYRASRARESMEQLLDSLADRESSGE